MSAHRGPVIRCVCCGRTGNHAARGLVDACYARHKKHDTLHRFRRRYQVVADTVEEYAFLSELGLDDTQIAARLGISGDALKYALGRAA
ncbi:hypothetical protein Lesp02_70480 [Lentzea sp. NBRC 105346]|uniref:hypothetical protein n=1 Tax=Lentzea sp. NBRC 105346 TaxID=3032205 RepID=UPI0024A02C5B|nr:hypothetical protein [Lentzea sp. NBRC 105346]GLZ34861.1 hypothetical protein Lesp02_70480 [Lentzea sp. NBRC 105346]